MKKLLALPAILLFLLFFGNGCQKEISPTILGDSTITKPVSVLRQIKVRHPSATDSFNYVFSLQYDTANKKINVFLDDTTTSNPFDLLVYSYEFNSAGYLINSSAADVNGLMQPDFSISRNGANQIQQIVEFNAEDINSVSYNDTVLYSYSSSSNLTVIQDSVRFQGQSGYATEITSYNNQNKPISANYIFNGIPDGRESYAYNSQGALTNIFANTDTIDFIYDNTTATNWQNLPQLFLGKDYYLLQREPLTSRPGYNFLTFIIEGVFETTYNPFLTKPLIKMVRHGYNSKNPTILQIKTVNFTNSFTSGNLLSSISVSPAGDDPFYYSFKYQ